MLKILFTLSFLCCGSAFAQNMEPFEDFNASYVSMTDGSSRYVGKCSTHEAYEKFYFSISKVLQNYTEPSDMTPSQIKKMLTKFDKNIIKAVLTLLDMYEIAQKGQTESSIFTDYIDDLSVDLITHAIHPELNLIRFNVGIGGGNGAYLVFNQVNKDGKTTYELMSHSMDNDLLYCDRKVWLQDNSN